MDKLPNPRRKGCRWWSKPRWSTAHRCRTVFYVRSKCACLSSRLLPILNRPKAAAASMRQWPELSSQRTAAEHRSQPPPRGAKATFVEVSGSKRQFFCTFGKKPLARRTRKVTAVQALAEDAGIGAELLFFAPAEPADWISLTGSASRTVSWARDSKGCLMTPSTAIMGAAAIDR